MKYKFDVAFLPTERLKNHDCRIVIDLLRATTQMVTFFDIGGETLVPVSEVQEAYDMKEKLGEEWALMGERRGIAPEGFNYGNSPTELIKDCKATRAIITTSNGTKALLRSVEDCEHVLIGCARNAEAVAWDALNKGKFIGIIPSGRHGEFSLEDTVCAGMIIEKLLSLAPSNGAEEMELTDGAMSAMALWQKLGADMEKIAKESHHGKILLERGNTEDIVFASELDRTGTVPVVVRIENGLPVIVGR
ncbi:MAG: 2-phosphosulfolactate phosphatase [Synergistaceae bacterium]